MAGKPRDPGADPGQILRPDDQTLVDPTAPPSGGASDGRSPILVHDAPMEPPRLPSPPVVAIPRGPRTFEMISMKSPAEIEAEKAARPARQVQLRSMAEAGRHTSTPPGGLGFLAPPRDPASEPKTMPAWLYVLLMVAGALVIAAAIAAAMWFLAFR